MRPIDDALYPCDPSKNTKCNKRGCFINGGPCQETSHIEYADVRSVETLKHHEYVEIVRCEDCKYWVCIEHEGMQHTACKLSENPRAPEYLYHPSAKDFCSRGERSNDDSD